MRKKRKSLKRIISLVLTVVMMVSIGTSVMAEENGDSVDSTTVASGITADGEIVIDSLQPIDSPDYEYISDSNSDVLISEDILNSFDPNSIPESQRIPSVMPMTMDYLMLKFDCIIDTEGGIYAIGPIELQPGQSCQAEMIMPNNPQLEYDLYIFEMNDQGELVLPVVDTSFNDGNRFNESVSCVNRTNVARTYYVISASRYGASATDVFTINLALDLEADGYEGNNSVKRAYPLKKVDLTPNQLLLSGASLNTPLDVDWYEIPAQNTRISSFTITVPDAAADKVYLDMFAYNDSNQLVYIDYSDIANGTICRQPFSDRSCFLRVTSRSRENFASPNYSLTFNPTIKPTSLTAKVYVGGEPLKTSTDWYDGERRFIIKQAEVMEVRVDYLNPDGTLDYSINDTVHVKVVNPAWREGTLSHTVQGKGVSSFGRATAPVKLGVTYTPDLYEFVDVEIWSESFGRIIKAPMALVKYYAW